MFFLFQCPHSIIWIIPFTWNPNRNPLLPPLSICLQHFCRHIFKRLLMIILKDSFLKFVIQHRHFFRKLGCMQSLASFQCAFPVGKEGFDYKETNNFRVSLKDQRPRPCQIHKYSVGSHPTTELTIHIAQCTLQ